MIDGDYNVITNKGGMLRENVASIFSIGRSKGKMLSGLKEIGLSAGAKWNA